MKRSHKRVFIGGSVKMMYLSLSLSLSRVFFSSEKFDGGKNAH